RRDEHVRPDLRHALRQRHRRGHARGDSARRRSPARLPGRHRAAMILDIRGIDTYYGLGHILHGLSLGVGEGEVVALLGRNGAGKTTTLRSITGLTPPGRDGAPGRAALTVLRQAVRGRHPGRARAAVLRAAGCDRRAARRLARDRITGWSWWYGRHRQ